MGLAAVAAVTYAINRWGLTQTDQTPSILRAYLGDLLALPVYLPLSAYLARQLKLIPRHFRFRVSHILLAVILFGILFEGLLPLMDGRATRDLGDIMAYLIGGGLILLVQAFCAPGHQALKEN